MARAGNKEIGHGNFLNKFGNFHKVSRPDFMFLFRLREGCDVLWWVCLLDCSFLCLSVRSHNSKTTGTPPNFTKFVCARCLLPWLCLTLTALRYVMHFRLYRWRRVLYHGPMGSVNYQARRYV